MSTVFAITQHELRRLFRSPFAWVVLAIVQFLLALIFFLTFDSYEENGVASTNFGITELIVAGLYNTMATILLILTPFLTMRGFSEEKKEGTILLLFSSPITVKELVIGKFLSTLIFFILIIFMVTLMPLSIGLGTNIDYWQISSSIIGLLLLVSAFTSIGLFITTLSSSMAVSAVLTFGILFLLLIMSFVSNNAGGEIAEVLKYLSLITHYNKLISGLFSTADVFYYLIMTVLFLALSVWRLDSERML